MEETLVLNGESVSIAYVAYYGRPADPGGRSFWSGVLTSNNINYSPKSGITLDQLSEAERDTYNTVINSFGNSDEARSIFDNLNTGARINQVYQFSFGRNADQIGLDFWSEAINNGSVSLPAAALEIALGAEGNDVAILTNRIASADLFTDTLVTRNAIGLYVGRTAEAIGREFIAGVLDTPSSQERVDEFIDRLGTINDPGLLDLGRLLEVDSELVNDLINTLGVDGLLASLDFLTGSGTVSGLTALLDDLLDLNDLGDLGGVTSVVNNLITLVDLDPLLGTVANSGLLDIVDALVIDVLGLIEGGDGNLLDGLVGGNDGLLTGLLGGLVGPDGNLLGGILGSDSLLGGLLGGGNGSNGGGLLGLGLLGLSAEPQPNPFVMDTPLTAVSSAPEFLAGIA